jgi:hypothetical protein
MRACTPTRMQSVLAEEYDLTYKQALDLTVHVGFAAMRKSGWLLAGCLRKQGLDLHDRRGGGLREPACRGQGGVG